MNHNDTIRVTAAKTYGIAILSISDVVEVTGAVLLGEWTELWGGVSWTFPRLLLHDSDWNQPTETGTVALQRQLPICLSCKDIRGFHWSRRQIEQHLGEHSNIHSSTDAVLAAQ